MMKFGENEAPVFVLADALREYVESQQRPKVLPINPSRTRPCA